MIDMEIIKFHPTGIVWPPSVVVWGALVPLVEADAMIAREPFCPDGLEVFRRWRREVQPS